MQKQLKIQIWSDVACPFCYIGKRKLEEALEKFEHNSNVELEWKSFQLNPDTNFPSGSDPVDYLANKYGRDRAWAISMHQNVTQQAKAVGLEYHLDKSIMANTLNAHRVSHLAKKHNLGNEFEEILFKAYFTRGLNIDDKETLMQLAAEAGLPTEETEEVLNSDAFKANVKQDIAEAQAIGVTGVPFFVFDNKYAVSGAQSPEIFLQTLQKTYQEGGFYSKMTEPISGEADSCGVDGCD
ncbi:MAG: DsbA family oxidoreductase [Flavobacterium sp.]